MSLERFHKAQERDYQQALKEIRNGRKESHWMWYIWPQLKGLGYSEMSQYYGLDPEEVEEYKRDDVLMDRLKEITQAIVDVKDKTAEEILGRIDAIKLRSCLELFVGSDPIFEAALKKYY